MIDMKTTYEESMKHVEFAKENNEIAEFIKRKFEVNTVAIGSFIFEESLIMARKQELDKLKARI